MARSILITGSSHGIGAGCAIAFARDEQANIGICGNKNPEGAQEIARQCEAYGAKTKIYLGDVGNHDFYKFKRIVSISALNLPLSLAPTVMTGSPLRGM